MHLKLGQGALPQVERGIGQHGGQFFVDGTHDADHGHGSPLFLSSKQ
jgi:hypothetical protein